MVVDIFEMWVREIGVDGFNLLYVIVFDDLCDYVRFFVFEFKCRGIFWELEEVVGWIMCEVCFGVEVS